MDTTPPSEQTAIALNWRVMLRLVIFALLMPGILFLAAGTLNWWEGWVFAGVFVVITIASRLLMFRTHPDLLQERARSMEAEDAKAWDKALVPIVAMYGPLVTWIVAGLDKRFTWSPQLALAWELGGLAVILLGYLLATTSRPFTWPMCAVA